MTRAATSASCREGFFSERRAFLVIVDFASLAENCLLEEIVDALDRGGSDDVHGLIHLMGFAKAFGYAELPQLTQPLSREMGLLWLAAGLLVPASAVVMVARPGGLWIVGGAALVISQLVILSAWRNAWAGTVVNVGATFTNGGQTISSATLSFGDDGLLTNFVSDDRSRSSPDGKAFTRLRFSTPVRDYRNFGPVRLATHGETRWTLPEGEFTYGEFDLQEAEYNVRS